MRGLGEEMLSILGPEGWLTGSEQIAGYVTDWTGRWSSEPLGVALAKTVDAVQKVVNAARAAGVAVVIQGGNTGLVGGAVGGAAPHLILSTRRLRERMDVNTSDSTMSASSGWTLSEVQAEAQRHGLQYPVDLASRDSATIGGTAATSAGGLRVVAFGDTSRQVLDTLYVDERGELVRGTGPVGLEGTTGVIVELKLRLRRPRPAQWTALVPCKSITHAVATAHIAGNGVLAAELMAGWQAQRVAEAAGLPLLDPAAWWLLLEGDEGIELLPEDALVAMDSRDAERFWRYRELHTEVISRQRQVLKLDAAVPVERQEEFVAAALRSAPGAWVFGHVLVGNLHLAVPDCEDPEAMEAVLISHMLACGGQLAGEHGVGQAKARFTGVCREEALFNPQIAR